MLSGSELHAMSQMEITDLNGNDLADIRTVAVDTELPEAQRIEKYLEQIRNPYCFTVGGTTVRLRFVGEKTLSQALLDYFIRLKQN